MKSFASPIFPFIPLHAVHRYFLFISKCCFLEPDTQRGFYSHDGNWDLLSVYTKHLLNSSSMSHNHCVVLVWADSPVCSSVVSLPHYAS